MKPDIDTLEKHKELFRDIAKDESIPPKIRERYGKRILDCISDRKENKDVSIKSIHETKGD